MEQDEYYNKLFKKLEEITEDFVELEMTDEQIKKYYEHIAAIADSLKQIL